MGGEVRRLNSEPSLEGSGHASFMCSLSSSWNPWWPSFSHADRDVPGVEGQQDERNLDPQMTGVVQTCSTKLNCYLQSCLMRDTGLFFFKVTVLLGVFIIAAQAFTMTSRGILHRMTKTANFRVALSWLERLSDMPRLWVWSPQPKNIRINQMNA